MRLAVKKEGKVISAWRLGDHSAMELQLMKEGRIKESAAGKYELFSREAVSGKGEEAQAGDFFKIDSEGYPYPNSRDFFESHHRHIEGDTYEQLPSPVQVWFWEDGMCAKVEFLAAKKSLRFNHENEAAFFSAPLWGTILTAAKNAAVVFYSIERDDAGIITDADFNFVAKSEFDKTYRFV